MVEIANDDHEYYRRLVDAGFLLTFGEDQTGLEMMYMYRGSGYYIDVGATELIVKGLVELRSGVTIKRIEDRGMVLNDGTKIEADLIVFATGFQSMPHLGIKNLYRQIWLLRLENVGGWAQGLSMILVQGKANCEICGNRLHVGVLWFHGGGLTQSRLYSRFLPMHP
ncbi:MAG: hypothetical protein CM1200mP6_07210 [Anaerolineaceae bacterium]|nr:MAG: hypothetical protein CM1200mP6_07210 [Anaerolineaceae bacterium]